MPYVLVAIVVVLAALLVVFAAFMFVRRWRSS